MKLTKNSTWKALLSAALIISLITACQEDVINEIEVPNATDNNIERTPLTSEQQEMIKYLDQTALLMTEFLHEPEVQEEVYKAVNLKYEGSHSIMFKFLFEPPVSKSTRLSTKAFINSFDKALAENNYPKSELSKGNASARTISEDLKKYLKDNNIEIYYPYVEKWGSKALPTITYNPFDNKDVNVGYRLIEDATSPNGYRAEKVQVDDEYAWNNPTWILDKNIPLPEYDSKSARFDPDYGTESYKGDRLDTRNAALVPAPKDGTAPYNKIFIGQVRTNGRNFEGLFGGGNKIKFYRAGEELIAGIDKVSPTETVIISRYNGRKGNWTTQNKIWDNNWRKEEAEQFFGVVFTDFNKNTTKEFSGDVSIGWSEGKWSATLKPFGYKIKIEERDEMIRRYEYERTHFFLENPIDAERLGIKNNVAIRSAGASGNSRGGIYYTMELDAYKIQ